MAEQDKIQIIDCLLSKSDEKTHIAAHGDIVSRSGKTLRVKVLGKQVALENYVRPETSDEDGDSAEYIYSGVLQNTAYHKVEVEYMHDSPWIYLINPDNGSALFANAGEHTVRHLSDRILLINNGFTPPLWNCVSSSYRVRP